MQLPIVLRAENAKKATFVPRMRNIPRTVQKEQYYIGYVTVHPAETKLENIEALSEEYQQHKKVFSEEQSQWLPQHIVWDHAIELLPGAPATLLGRLLHMTQTEQKEMSKFVAEHLKRGTIHEL